MTAAEWVGDTAARIRAHGMDGVRESAYEFYLGTWRRIGRRISRGKSIFAENWDVLVVLDACRCDLIESIENEYGFLDTNHRFTSLGNSSEEWMRANFSNENHEKMAETAYVSGNLFTRRHADPNRFDFLDEVWRYGWDDERGTVPARTITDRAIAIHRDRKPERMIVHYMQPHAPSVPDPIGQGMSGDPEAHEIWRESALDLLRRGEVTKEEVWQSYEANLRYVLNDVALLLNNITADTVAISADHGELMGESGLYGHPRHIPLSTVREVPWYLADATNKNIYQPAIDIGRETGDIDEKLKQLGYR